MTRLDTAGSAPNTGRPPSGPASEPGGAMSAALSATPLPEWRRRQADRPPMADWHRRRHHCSDTFIGQNGADAPNAREP
jgi:hypothetical protein